MNVMPKSAAARDIAYYIHPQTNLRRHQEAVSYTHLTLPTNREV